MFIPRKKTEYLKWVLVLVTMIVTHSFAKVQFEYLGNYPKEKGTSLAEELQGVTHNDSDWFFSNENHLYRIPVSSDLNQGSRAATASTGIPAALKDYGFDHYGDIDYYLDKLYVALEGGKRNGKKAVAIGVFDSNLNYITHVFLPDDSTNAAWVAINPKDNLLYTAKSQNTSKVQKYRMDWAGSQLSLTQVGEVELNSGNNDPITIKRIQGGVFSKQGNLYLVDDKAGGGIKIFDSHSGDLLGSISVEVHPELPYVEELEGMTIWDLDDGRAPNIRGQIHLILLDNDWPDGDDWYFKHYRASDLNEM